MNKCDRDQEYRRRAYHCALSAPAVTASAAPLTLSVSYRRAANFCRRYLRTSGVRIAADRFLAATQVVTGWGFQFRNAAPDRRLTAPERSDVCIDETSMHDRLTSAGPRSIRTIALRSIAYRPDIDCLRAFAVISVIAFHYDIPPFRSGFVGVDVFFVISGFLITTIISSEIGAGVFSLAAFYRRRARRILPAAFVMLAAVLAVSSFVLLPQDNISVASQALAMLTFCSNVLFWSQQGYFDSAVITKPLLHTWSLAVEEQYYLLFPVAAVFAFSFRRAARGHRLCRRCGRLACRVHRPDQPAARGRVLSASGAGLGARPRGAAGARGAPGAAERAAQDHCCRGGMGAARALRQCIHNTDALSRRERAAALPRCRGRDLGSPDAEQDAAGGHRAP